MSLRLKPTRKTKCPSAHGRRVKRKLQSCTTVLSCVKLIVCFRHVRVAQSIAIVVRVWGQWSRDQSWISKIQIMVHWHQTPDSQTFWPKDTSHCDEWNKLLCLFNFSHFGSLCCAKNFSLISCITERMAKRMQEHSEKNRIVAKSRPSAINLTSSVAASSFISEQSDCVEESPGYSKLQVDRLDYQGSLMQTHGSKFQSRRSVQFSRTAKRCSTVLQHRETCGNGHGSELSESAGRTLQHRETCGNGDDWTPRTFRKISKSQKIQEIQNQKSKLTTLFPRKSPGLCAPHMEKVFSVVRKI